MRYGGDGARLLAEYNPGVQYVIARDEERAYTSEVAPTIATVRSAFGTATAESWVIAQLNNLSEYVGVREKLRIETANEVAAMMIAEAPTYRLTEFMLFFQYLKRGRYGRFYGTVDPVRIMEAFGAFAKDREAAHKRIADARAERARAEEHARAEREREEFDEVYRRRVPGGEITPEQYRFMGFGLKTDAELAADIEAIRAGTLELPSDSMTMLTWATTPFPARHWRPGAAMVELVEAEKCKM